MPSWQEALQSALDYIEENLTGEIDVHDVAARAYVSAYHFQRVFSATFGMPLGEYVRCRRLTLAAQELAAKEVGLRPTSESDCLQSPSVASADRKGRDGRTKVIDAAVKYGYDSPDSFARAFRRFHGVLPSQAGLPGVMLRSLTPMKIEEAPEVRQTMDYRIETKEAFTVVGYRKQFSNDTSYQEIPKWWEQMQAQQSAVMGMFGVCIDTDGKLFDYLIADLYRPWQAVPEGCITHAIPGGTWAVFPCTLGTLQDTNTRMWRDWLPACREYRLGGSYNLEFYYELNEADPPSSPVELWLPLQPA